MTNTLGVQAWLDVIGKEYLQGFVKDGGSSIKFVVPVSSSLGPLLKETFAGIASNLGYMVARVDSSETRVHMPQEIFFKVAQQIDWRLLAKRMILRLSEGVYLNSMIDPQDETPILQALSVANSVEEHLIGLELRRRLPNAVTTNVNMSKDFRAAMTHLCLTEMGGPGESPEASPLIEWLTGQNRRVSNVRAYSVYNAINRTNARHFFESLLYWVRYTGYAGTVVVLDNSRVTLSRNPRDGLLYYSRLTVMEHYELLREFIDSTDRLESFLMVILANIDFLNEDTNSPGSRGYAIYRALMGRIADEVHDRSQVNPMSTLVRLSD